MFVDIEGWGIISYLYPTERDIDFDALHKSANHSIETKMLLSKSDIVDNLRYRICYASQMDKDETFKQPIAWTTTNLKGLCSDNIEFSHESFTIDWFYTKMLYYDSVIIDTHGMYNNGVHWILTANEIGIEKWVDNYSELEDRFSALADFETMASCVKEIRNGVEYRVWYISISEKAIENIPGNGFETNRPHIVFNTACQSVMGNRSLADAFIHQGANFYFGFDEINYIGHKSAMELFFYLVNGCSVLEAFSVMKYLVDYKSGAKLNCYGDNENDPSSTFILPPYISEELFSALGQYLPINRGYKPPFIEGEYLVNPIVYLYDSSYSHFSGQQDSNPVYFRFTNQDSSSLTIAFEAISSGGIEYDHGIGHVYGRGNSFTIISNGITEVTGFTMDNSLNMENYTMYGEGVWIISGTKDGNTIKNWQYGWLFTDITQNRPEGGIIKFPEIGTVMVFKDGDGVSSYYPFPS